MHGNFLSEMQIKISLNQTVVVSNVERCDAIDYCSKTFRSDVCDNSSICNLLEIWILLVVQF